MRKTVLRKPPHIHGESTDSAGSVPPLMLQQHTPAALVQGQLVPLQRAIGNRSVTQILRRKSLRRTIQRDDDRPITMDPLKVAGNRPGDVEQNIVGLDQLRGQGVDPKAMSMAHSAADIARNSPNPTTRLPFSKSGWNGDEILNRLGQYDTQTGTDSDAHRCVQAVAMASHIPDGPNSVISYLGTMRFEGILGHQIGQRQRTAMNVIRFVADRIRGQTATYGDLSWAQEAIHDLFYNDVSGTPEDDIRQQTMPTMDAFTRSMDSLNIWCNNPAEVMAQANQLAPGGQLIVTTWSVVLDTTFDQLEDEHIPTQDHMKVRINGHEVWIKRVPLDKRPRPEDLDINRDTRSGHQLLIMRENTQQAAFKLYEPEITQSGQHLQALTTTGGELKTYFKDDTTAGIYSYVQIMGKITPKPPSTF
jgi:hypothetical protein